jgi:hypothetical protein
MSERTIDVSNKDSYYFFVACRAVLCAPDLTDAEKLVFIAFHGRENVEMSGDQPSMQNVGSWLGKDRRNVRRALDGLERKGYAHRTHRRNGRGTTVVDVETFLPTQAAEAGRAYLKRGRVTLRVEPGDEASAVEPPANGGVTLTPPENAHPGGHLDPPDGLIRGGHLDPPIRNKHGENGEPDKRPADAAGLPGHPEGGGPLRDQLREVREKLRGLNLEGGSLEVQQLREEERSLLARIKDADKIRPEPSTRPKWNGWRRRNPSNWRDADLVGYWVCRYREARGSEDPAFAPCDSAYELRVARTCRNYTELHLGASGERWRDAVDGILAKAEGAGHPVSLAYHILPRNPAVLASLDRPRGGGKAPSPVEVNDAWGEDRAHWDKKAAEIQEKRRRKAEKLGIPLSQVKLHVGEEV